MSTEFFREPSVRPSFPTPEVIPHFEPDGLAIVDDFVGTFVYTDERIEDTRQRLAYTLRGAPNEAIAPLKEGAFSLCRGIDAHENANLLFHGTWQVALQRKQREVGTAELSRAHIEEAFKTYTFARDLESHEKQAMEKYRDALSYLDHADIHVRPTIRLTKVDVEVLLNDLAQRRISRHGDELDRVLRFHELDNQLHRIIADIPLEDEGKRGELQTLSLLRQLIHAAKCDHLVQADHGTIREDLRIDRGNIDLFLVVAGEVFPFQLKTLKQSVGYEARAVQYDVLLRAKAKLQYTDTILVELERDQIDHEYRKSLKEEPETIDRLSRYKVLEALFDALPKKARATLLHALRLTEEDLAPQVAALAAGEHAIAAAKEALRAKLNQEGTLDPAYLANQARREAEQKRQADIRAKEAALAEQGRKATEDRERARQENKQAKLAATEAAKKLLLRTKKAAVTRAMNAEERAKFWHQGPISKLTNIPNLKRLGFLSADWTSSDISALTAAKHAFAEQYAKPKKDKPPTIDDLINDAFVEQFPTKEAFEQATSNKKPGEKPGLGDQL